MIVGIAFLIVGLLVSVGLHELGHLIPAKKFGVKVTQYFIGFGPTLFSRHFRGTEYGLKALPLGGFVRIAGMLPPGREGRQTHTRSGNLTMAEEARVDSAAEVEGEEERALWRLSAPKKLAVMFGGPLMNLILAFVCIGVVVSGIGLASPTTTLGRVSPCVTQQAECSQSDPVSPAAAAGLEQGDTVLSWGGTPIGSWDELYAVIGERGTAETSVVVERDGQDITVNIAPIMVERQVTNERGEVVVDAAGKPVTQERAYVGISPAYARQSQPLGRVPGVVWKQSVETTKILVTLPVRLWNTTQGLFTGEERSGSGIVGVVGVAEMAGQITSIDAAQYDRVSRLGDLLLILGSLNLTLFLFNLIPLLPLDGGYLACATVEGVRRWVARRRGRPDPGPVDVARFMPVSFAVTLLFVLMTVILVVADVVNPVNLLN